jgi:hypothetical protein
VALQGAHDSFPSPPLSSPLPGFEADPIGPRPEPKAHSL